MSKEFFPPRPASRPTIYAYMVRTDNVLHKCVGCRYSITGEEHNIAIKEGR